MNVKNHTISQDEILHDAIQTLTNLTSSTEVNCATLQEQIQLLTLFAKRITSEDQQSNSNEIWLESTVFDLCFEYFLKLNPKKTLTVLQKNFSELFTLCCHNENTYLKAFDFCVEVLQDNFISNSKEAGLDLENSTGISIDASIYLIHILLNSSLSKIACKQETRVEILAGLLLKLLQSDITSELSFTAVCGLVKVVLGTTQIIKVDDLWSCILYLFKADEVKLFILLALLLPLLAPTKIITTSDFWGMLQEGLIHKDALTRKRALYIMRWLVDHISRKDNFLTDTCENNPWAVMFWNQSKQEHLWSIWKTFILVCEFLEEKQLHVIKPVLPLFDELFEATILEDDKPKLLHFSWILVILKRAMTHDSKLLNKWALQYFLQMDLKKFPMLSDSSHTFIFVHLPMYLQSTSIYGKEEHNEPESPPVIFSLLTKFFTACLDSLDAEQQLQFCRKVSLWN